MYAITLRTGKRTNKTHGYFQNKDVADYVAQTLKGWVDGDTTYTGEVVEIDVDTSATVEEYRASALEAEKLAEQEAFAELFNGLSAEHQALLRKHANAIPGTAASAPAE